MQIRNCLCFLAVAATALVAADNASMPVSADLRLESLVCVTPRPTRLRPVVLTLCLPATAKKDHSILVGQADAVAHVFVSPDAIEPMLKRDSTPFPIGSVVVKQKLEALNPHKVILYTGMLKRENGFNPNCGDWEFFTLSPNARMVTSRGRLASCMACHQHYERSDFVTKEYPLER